MVDRIMRNPEVAQIMESDLERVPALRRGLCLICGEWLDADDGVDLYTVTLTRANGDVSEHVAHVPCMARAAHPGARLPGAGSGTSVPDDHLAGKRRTPSGR